MAQNEHVYVSGKFGRITGTRKQLEELRCLLVDGCAQTARNMVKFRENGEGSTADYCWNEYLELRAEYEALDKYLEEM